MAMHVFYESLGALQFAAKFAKSWEDTGGRARSYNVLEAVCLLQDQVVEAVGERHGVYLADDEGNVYTASAEDAEPEILFSAAKSASSGAKFCPYCGAPITGKWKFCKECGSPIPE